VIDPCMPRESEAAVPAAGATGNLSQLDRSMFDSGRTEHESHSGRPRSIHFIGFCKSDARSVCLSDIVFVYCKAISK
jgi:hypothetical protein